MANEYHTSKLATLWENLKEDIAYEIERRQCKLTAEQAIEIAKQYGLEEDVRLTLKLRRRVFPWIGRAYTPAEALEEWDIPVPEEYL